MPNRITAFWKIICPFTKLIAEKINYKLIFKEIKIIRASHKILPSKITYMIWKPRYYFCIRSFFNILYYTLELSETYVARRMDANLLGIPVDRITMHREEIESMTQGIAGKIKIKEFPAGKTTLDNIEQHIEQLRMQYEFVPDVIYIDYIDLLKNSSRDRLEGTEDIYTSIRGLATELGIPIVTPSQANRTGAKSDIIEGDNIAGSYSKLMIGDIVLSLARNRKDKLENTGRWHVMKNRLGGDGMTFASTIDTSMGKIEIFEDFLEIDTTPTDKKPGDYNAVDRDEKDFLRNFILNS
jgi:hypothetical protein